MIERARAQHCPGPFSHGGASPDNALRHSRPTDHPAGLLNPPIATMLLDGNPVRVYLTNELINRMVELHAS